MTLVSSDTPWKTDAVAQAMASEAKSKSGLARYISRFYRFGRLRGLVQRACFRLEDGPMFSATWRQLLASHHGVHIGRYSYGDILKPGLLPRGTVVGNYCSVGTQLIIRRRNHPIARPFLHPFFYNSRLGLLRQDTIKADPDNPLTIGHDVWIADRVTILSGCRHIGNGAVIAAGAVVTRDVPAYSVVAGTPAKQLRMRFDIERIIELEASGWWNQSIADVIHMPPVAGIFGPDSDSPPLPVE